MSNRVASSRSWFVALVCATSVLHGCGDEGQEEGGQTEAGTRAGSSGHGETGTDEPRADAGERESGSGGSTGAAGSGGRSGTAGKGVAGSASGAAGAATTPTMDDGAATWSSIYQFVFWSCRNESCHGSGLAGVDFRTKDAAWETMVEKPANPMFQCAQLGKPRIQPGEPDNSLLYLKLDINSPCGQQMPPGGQLQDSQRERVREWIMLGAKND